MYEVETFAVIVDKYDDICDDSMRLNNRQNEQYFMMVLEADDDYFKELTELSEKILEYVHVKFTHPYAQLLSKIVITPPPSASQQFQYQPKNILVKIYLIGFWKQLVAFQKSCEQYPKYSIPNPQTFLRIKSENLTTSI